MTFDLFLEAVFEGKLSHLMEGGGGAGSSSGRSGSASTPQPDVNPIGKFEREAREREKDR